MKHLKFLLSVLYTESKKRNFIFKSLLFSLLYISFSMILVNYKSFFSFLQSDYSVISKAKIFIIIFIGSFQAITLTDLVLLITVALLFGLNMQLVMRKIKFLASSGGLHLTFGVGLLTLAATGCASCGLSIASVVGLSAVLASLPFRGLELYIISIIILLASLIYNLHTLVKVCKIEPI